VDEREAAGVEFELMAAGGELARAAVLAREQIAARLFMAAPPVVRIADRYVLRERIGAGGQGSVWRARDEQLDRDVAIKVVHVRDLARDEAANLLLRREAQMLGRLAHPGVVAVFDLGLCPAAVFGGPRDDRMVLFVVMELVAGVGLDEWTRTGDRSTAEILDVLDQVAAGLAAVHACGLVHCDVKPGNILVLVDGGVAKLADFGLAHATRSIAEALDDGVVTDSSTFRSMASGGVTLRSPARMGGTPRYMAPEQMQGGVIDARADEYALAATLFEALYWRPPHEGKTLQALRLAKQRGAPPQPDARLGRKAYAALARSLAPDPAARHGDVRVAMRAIATAQRSNRRRLNVALACVGVLGALGLAMPARTQCEQSTATLDEATAVLESVAAHGDDLGRRVAERALARFHDHARASIDARATACAAPDRVVTSCLDRVDTITHEAALAFADLDMRHPHRAVTLVERLPDPRECLGGAADPIAVGPALDPDDAAARTAWSQLSRARSLDAAGDPRAALDVLDAIEIADADALAIDVMLARGSVLHRLGRMPEALAVYDAAYLRAEATGAALDAARAAAGAAQTVGVGLQEFDDGLAWVRHGETQLGRAATPSRIRADLLSAKGTILFLAGRYAESRPELEAALAIAQGGPADRVRALRNSVSIAKIIDGDPDALEYLTETWELTVLDLGEEHPDAIAVLANLGNAQARSGRYADGRASMERALELREQVFGPDAHENAKLWSTLAELDKAEGDHTAAIVKLRRASELRERGLPEDHPERALGTIELAELLMVAAQLDAAERVLAENVDRFASAFAAEHPVMLDFVHARGELALRRGRHDEAARLIGAAVDGARSIGLQNDDVAIWQLEAAAAEAALGRTAPAREYVDAAYVRYADLSVLMQGELDRMRAALPPDAQGAPPTYQR
jgi:tetratricopeptide (TPR) repeat protein